MNRACSVVGVLLACCGVVEAAEASRPNILFMIADDLGYRDLGCYGATRIQTPRIDALAGEGLRFTDAHSTAAFCMPSRYAILSGTYFFHAKRNAGYAIHFHEGQVTLPSALKQAGYKTAAFGKWHNGFGRVPDTDWNAELKPGPREIGFDTFFGTPRTHNEPPLVYVQDHWIVGLEPDDPISVDHAPQYGQHGKMIGGAKARAARPDDQIEFLMADKAVAFLREQTPEQPFFLYLAMTAPHVPINPAREFRGRSEAELYGDYIEQLDHCVGRVLDALTELGLAGNTLVVFTSDNGGKYDREATKAGHRTNGELLGQKTDAWEGGHRVPLIARWPGQIPAGSVREEFFLQVDLMATIAEAAKIELPEGASPDGVSELAAFTSPDAVGAGRMEGVLQGTSGLVLRQGDWIYLPKQGSAGRTVPEPAKPWGMSYAAMGFFNSDVDERGQIRPGAANDQLYNLAEDLPQSKNLASEQPERASAMRARLGELTARANNRRFLIKDE